jgi:hypothetical protein
MIKIIQAHEHAPVPYDLKKTNYVHVKLELIVACILLIGSFLYFLFVVPYHIYFKEQIQLFIYDSTYILSYFSKPGGLACLTGDYLTQFLYLTGGGAVVISLLFVVEWLLIVRILNSFGIKKMAPLWALIPVITEWCVISEINSSLAMTVAFAFILFVIYIYTRIQNKMISIVLGIILIPLLYVLFGSAMFLFPVSVLLYEIHTGKNRYVYWLIIIGLAAIIPALLRSYYLITFIQAYFYPYLEIKQEMGIYITAAIFLLASFKGIRKLPVTIFSFSLTIILILIYGISSLAFTTNFEREKILGMATEVYFENWNKVLKIAEKTKLENSIATYYTNIALSKQMQLGDRMMEFYQPFVSGLFLPVNSQSGWFTIFFSSDVYFYIGDMNMAQHSAILGMTFSPYQRSSRLIYRLAEINVVAGDIPAAMKYIRMFETSLFHKKRADNLKKMAFAKHPEDYTWLQNKRNQIHTYDMLRSSQNPQTSLELLLKANPDNLAALDYLLAFHLMNKNIPEFFNVYSTYLKNRINYVPKVYSEALLIYFAATKTKPEILTEFHINPIIVKNFNNYTQLYGSSNGNLELLKEKFPHTYWLFYHFATIKT